MDKSLLIKLILPVVGACFLLPGNQASAHISQWQKGVSIVPTNTYTFATKEFQESLDQLKTANADYVTLVIPYYQKNITASVIEDSWNTPTDESLELGIAYAKRLGLKVMLKPHMELERGGWRANINPRNRRLWFNDYSGRLYHLAEIAEKHKVEQICIGTELIGVASGSANPNNTQEWIQIIDNLREIYSGKLTYSANWGGAGNLNEKFHIGFWDKLDYLGISAYHELWGSTASDLESAWDYWNKTDISKFYNQFQKPILFTEVGYRSMNQSHRKPYDYVKKAAFDQDVQASAYEALFNYWNNVDYIAGVHIWDWEPYPSAGGHGNINYTPQNKLAQTVMAKWFSLPEPAVNAEQTYENRLEPIAEFKKLISMLFDKIKLN